MQIFLRGFSPRTEVLELDSNYADTAILGGLIENRTGVPIHMQRIVCDGKQLDVNTVLTSECTLHLSLRILGGVKNPGHIKNKMKRAEIYKQYKSQKKNEKKKLRQERIKEVEALGEAAPPKQVPRTIENTREYEETTVKPDDDEVLGDENDDEFAAYFNNESRPKIMITTRPKCSRKMFPFIGDLMQMIPQAFY
jgi:hypothetical protein